MGTPIPPPPPGALQTPDGKLSDRFYQWLQSMQNGVAGAISSIGTINGQQDVLDFTETSPDNQVYPLEINAPYGYTITKVDSFCESGSCTAQIKIGSTPLGGGANSVSTTLQSKTHSSNNVVAVGDASTVTISSNSSCSRMRLVIWYTRT